MTFSVCVHEPYEADEGCEHHRFGVAVTTRLPAVGRLCPFVTENGAIATQSHVNVDLGRDGIAYVDDGLAVDDALPALLAADDGAPLRQLHGVDAETTFVFSGDECGPWYGHLDGDRYTVAGNLLAGESVVEAVAETYEAQRDEDRPLEERLIDALEAGQVEGGDKREGLSVQSAALLVEDTEAYEFDPSTRDLRIDASRQPIADLRETYELAAEAHETLLERVAERDEETP
ncbi:DUF1028 domain-containing protein [Halovivax cerinus]|uniref:DUF1028 domain-containing protein n=1 Tax=Halovivax cerinus TaxID=1487865 RepID=A0ABD5NLD2_9EURY|nr:DUF1028 domain-containing protein [Halovivax cerinus]